MADEITASPSIPELTQADAIPQSSAPPPPPAGDPVSKQLNQFLWAGIAVGYGCLLPFNTHAAGWQSDKFDAALRGPLGIFTVPGSLGGFIAAIFILSQLRGLKTHRVEFKPLLLMMCMALWSWLSFVPGLKAAVTFPCSKGAAKSVGDALLTGDVVWIGSLLQHLGSGHLFILVGSSIPVLIFLKAFVQVLVPKKKAVEAGAAAGAGKTGDAGRGRRSRGSR